MAGGGSPDAPQHHAGIALDHGGVNDNLFLSGRLITMPGYSFVAKRYDLPSDYGIERGKISKLDVRKDGKLVLRYDRGWVTPPKTQDHREALIRIRNGLDDPPRIKFRGLDRKNDRPQDLDR